jgi:hypothetical protein
MQLVQLPRARRASAVKSAVDALVADGGADNPECYTRALYESQFFSWRY